MTATLTDTEPESEKKTVSRPAGVTCTSSCASRAAGLCVRPPNMTWFMVPSCPDDRGVQERVSMAVDSRPPRTHRIDDLNRLTVADERQPGAAGADRDHRRHALRPPIVL